MINLIQSFFQLEKLEALNALMKTDSKFDENFNNFVRHCVFLSIDHGMPNRSRIERRLDTHEGATKFLHEVYRRLKYNVTSLTRKGNFFTLVVDYNYDCNNAIKITFDDDKCGSFSHTDQIQISKQPINLIYSDLLGL